MDGGQTFTVDIKTGICRITGTGMWSVADAEQHFREITVALRPLRQTGRAVVFLVDMRDADVQSRETAHAMSEGTQKLHRPTDIIAVVTRTVLHALQVEAFAKQGRLKTFQDMGEGQAWALSLRDGEPAAPVAADRHVARDNRSAIVRERLVGYDHGRDDGRNADL